MKVQEILETCLYVDDLPAAEVFYRDTLGLELFARQAGRHVFFRCGQRMLLLFDAQACGQPDSELPPHGAHGPGHVAFAARQAELESWSAWLRDHGVTIEQVVSWPGGGQSLYFRDPAGNSLELATPRIWGLDETTTLSASPGTATTAQTMPALRPATPGPDSGS
ncbi:MAG: VOC family protein [Pirellulaceae bacterium]|nr:VOC family protein [Pirellulaceae bacterium]